MMIWLAAVENTGTSSEIKEQYEKNEKFVGGEFFIPPYIFSWSGICKMREGATNFF